MFRLSLDSWMHWMHLDAPIINFLKNEACEFSNMDGIKILDQYIDNKKALIFLDPPYLMSCNAFYNNPECNIYEHLSSLELKKKKSPSINKPLSPQRLKPTSTRPKRTRKWTLSQIPPTHTIPRFIAYIIR